MQAHPGYQIDKVGNALDAERDEFVRVSKVHVAEYTTDDMSVHLGGLWGLIRSICGVIVTTELCAVQRGGTYETASRRARASEGKIISTATSLVNGRNLSIHTQTLFSPRFCFPHSTRPRHRIGSAGIATSGGACSAHRCIALHSCLCNTQSLV